MSASALPIVCPFCPLYCDDVIVAADGSVNVDCRRAADGFAAARNPAPARVGVTTCSIDEARKHAETLLRGGDFQPHDAATSPDPLPHDDAAGETANSESSEARGAQSLATDGPPPAAAPQVTVVTAGTDLMSAKQLETLRDGERIRLTLDAAPSGQAIRSTVRRDGILSATQGAIRGHADVIWSIGDFSSMPRIWQRLIDPARPPRHVAIPAGMTAEETANISDALRRGDASQLSDPHASLCQALLASRYVAVVLGTDAWPQRDSVAAAVMLNQIVLWLAAERRAVLLSLDAAATNRTVAIWRTNRTLEAFEEAAPRSAVPTRSTREERDGAESVPGAARLGVPDAEVLVRLGEPASGNAAPAQLQLGGRDPGRELADIYLPAAMAGVHRAGIAVRGDGSVTLPLQQVFRSELPTAAEWLMSLLGESIC